MEPDELLVEKTLTGDQEAFRKLVDRYKTVVYAICMNIVKDTHEAENLSQETFIQAYRSLRQYENKGFKTWLGRIATNKSIDWKRRQRHKVVYLSEIEDTVPNDGPAPYDRMLKKEIRDQITLLCSQLPDRYGIVIKKYYIQSKSYKQIADEEGISIKTVESRLYRAKSLMRNKWKEEDRYDAF